MKVKIMIMKAGESQVRFSEEVSNFIKDKEIVDITLATTPLVHGNVETTIMIMYNDKIETGRIF